MAQTVPPSFVENGAKLRLLILVIGEWPETAKNRGEPQKMTYCSKTDIWGGLNGKVVALGILVICPVDKNCDYHQKIDFAPNIQICGSKSTFCPQWPIGSSSINVFSTKKVSPWFPDMRVPEVLLSPPQKLDFWPKNGQILPKTGILAKYRHFCPFDLRPDQRTMRTSCRSGFLLCWYQNFTYSHKN